MIISIPPVIDNSHQDLVVATHVHAQVKGAAKGRNEVIQGDK